jgi:hypothetical protein
MLFLTRITGLLRDLLTSDLTNEQLDAKLDNLAAASPVDLDKDQSIVDLLKTIGKDSDFKSRAKLASHYCIADYTGTAEQNVELHGRLMADLKSRREKLPQEAR